MGKRQDRIDRIVQTLQTRSAATIQELSRDFGVSDITIRRDLSRLAQENVVRLLHSGAVINPDLAPSELPRYSLAEEGAVHAAEKQRIGRVAAAMVDSLQLADAMRIYRERFADAGDFTSLPRPFHKA